MYLFREGRHEIRFARLIQRDAGEFAARLFPGI